MIELGSFPVRYLGVPLVTRKLTESDCSPLIEKIKRRIQGCKAMQLTYADRVQVIQ